MNLLQRAPWEPGQERADLTALEITRSGIVSVVHQLGTPLLHGPHRGSDPQGYSVAQLVTAPIADALRRGMARALRERQLATARYEGDGIAEDYLMVPLGRDRVLVIARDDRMPAAMLARAEALAYEDPVTGLPNRARLETLLQSLVANQAVREGRLAVIAVHLSQLDDLCFGLGGDQLETVLRVLAERLQEQVRGSNAVDEEDPERFRWWRVRTTDSSSWSSPRLPVVMTPSAWRSGCVMCSANRLSSMPAPCSSHPESA